MYAFCACLRIVVSNTYCVVFLLDFSSSYLPYATRLIGLSIFDWQQQLRDFVTSTMRPTPKRNFSTGNPSLEYVLSRS